VVAPEHPVIKSQISNLKNQKEVEAYIEKARKKTEMERTELAKEKTGVKLEGVVAINPVNKEEIPVFVADYVMMHYGTGAIMAVPAHDERDFAFAQMQNTKTKDQNEKIIIRSVVDPDVMFIGYTGPKEIEQEEMLKITAENRRKILNGEMFYIHEGTAVNSGFLNGLPTREAKEKMIQWLEENGLGERDVNYKLKDWVFSRQRYWGEPIPVVHCGKCGVVAVPEEELPVKLPEVDHYEPTGTGESPLANIEDWVNTKCPKCEGPAKRETNTMPQWAGSSWYYLRFIDPDNDQALVDKDKEKYWSPVDFYVGGAEHATRHLIYARFWHKFLYDIGAVNYSEPFTRLQHVGIILAEDGRKMSKRWGNVINPNDVVDKYGADAMRVYEMFVGPFSQSVAWSTNGLVGARKFLEKVVGLADRVKAGTEDKPEVVSQLHKTIKKVSEDIEGFKLNTAVSAMMILANKIQEVHPEGISQEAFGAFLKLLAPFAPHLAEELWQIVGNKGSIFEQPWPNYQEEFIRDETIELVLQVNGKVRDKLSVPADISEDEAKEKAMASQAVQKWTQGKEIVKVVFVPGKLVNVVVK
jgi:leucyl-tRNA synthetase